MIRWQSVKGRDSDKLYVTYYGHKLYLSEMMRFHSEDDKRIVGVINICNNISYVIRHRWNHGDCQFAVTLV